MIPSDSPTDPPPEEELIAETNIKKKKTNKKKKKKRRRRRKVVTPEEISASRFVHAWAFPEKLWNDEDEELALKWEERNKAGRIVFELHSHSHCSDGFLSPSALVERAHSNGVRVLALTDHDTMSGIGEAIEAAGKFGMKIIPGVEISASHFSKEEAHTTEPVHILAYYGKWGPAKYSELERMLSSIREGRYLRAKEMLSKLDNLKMPLKFEQILKLAGTGVAPGRVHVARAMVEAGYVENLRQAFNRYLYDGGPAYATGSEPDAEEVVKLICRTGGVSVLAHPWALKNPISVVKSLKSAGLHAIEVHRSDGKLSGLSDLADSYGLLKVGGSDFHGRKGCEEPDLGSVNLPILAVYEFLNLAQPIWCNALKDILSTSSDNNNHDLKENGFSFPGSGKLSFEFPELEVLGTKLSFVTTSCNL
ncbi:hypothetical protein LUZ60_001179 [Juncus effusus]|nr:hypothetical protein LUZ60_001179 [Juncus effusus]